MATTDGRTVFVLGREVDGNRQAVIMEDAQEYNIDADTIVEYSDATAAFPYEV
jgi:hypothetical protein